MLISYYHVFTHTVEHILLHIGKGTRMKRPFLYFTLLVLNAAAVYAEDTTATAAPSVITWSGFVDAYYSKNFNSPSSSTNQLRNFDFSTDQFALSLAELVIQKQASPVGFRVDLDFGSTNDFVQVPNTGTLNLVQQAYLTTVLPIGSGLTVDVGKFVTHMGYEVIESKDNWNYSRSYLFAYAIPYFHVGLRMTYPMASNFSAGLHIVNGWNYAVAANSYGVTADNNKSKSVGLQLIYSPTSSTGIIFNGMTGFEQPTGVPYGKRNVFDLIINQSVNDNLLLGLNVDYGQERVASFLNIWKGAAIYCKYVIGPKSDVAVRAEVYYDPFAYTTLVNVDPTVPVAKTTLKEITLTYGYHLFEALTIRGELRDDFANGPAFVSASTSPTSPISGTSQPTLLVGVVAVF